MRPAGNKAPTLIIGGGASGLAAACVLARAGQAFILLEKEEKPGRKLLATGNGRCNLMNAGRPVYFGDTAFALKALSACGAAAVSGFFEDIGLSWFEEEQGRCYPLSRQAVTVLDCLLGAIEQAGTGRLLFGREVSGLERTADGFRVETSQGEAFEAGRLIACPGSPAAPKLGGSEGLMAPLGRLGHEVLPFFPALCALETEKAPLKGLSGLRVPAWLTLLAGGQPLAAAAGELLYTDYGVSGLCAMQLARDVALQLAQGKAPSLRIDLSPLLGLKEALMRRLEEGETGQPQDSLRAVRRLLEDRRARLGEGALYTGLLPRQIRQKVEGLPLDMAAAWLSGLTLPVTGTRGFDQAQVAAGGLDCRQVDPKTMASRLVPGLYLCGEALNVDGDTGGFNLLFAWTSGILAARAAAGLSPGQG